MANIELYYLFLSDQNCLMTTRQSVVFEESDLEDCQSAFQCFHTHFLIQFSQVPNTPPTHIYQHKNTENFSQLFSFDCLLDNFSISILMKNKM